MSDIYRIYEPNTADRNDIVGYLRIDCFGEESWVQRYDTDFHVIEERRVNLARYDPGFLDACGFDKDHGYAIMYDGDFFRRQKAQKQREYRARRKARQKKEPAENMEAMVTKMQQMLLFPGAQAAEPEDLYRISMVAESEGNLQLSNYIRTQGDRMKAQELSPRDAVRNVILACHAEREGGEREEDRMVAEPEELYEEQNRKERIER